MTESDVYLLGMSLLDMRKRIQDLEKQKRDIEAKVKEYLAANGGKVSFPSLNMLIETETQRRLSLTKAKALLSSETIESLCTVSVYERIKVW